MTTTNPARGERVPWQAARVLPLPATTTALLMGDPLPGRSALDRRVTA